jgi:hypothetical protein
MRARAIIVLFVSTVSLAAILLAMYVLLPGIYSLVAEGARKIESKVLGSEVHVLSFTTSDPELISRIAVFRGSFEGFRGDPRLDNHIRLFPYALLVAEKKMEPSGRITFLLRPGSYFIYATVDPKMSHELTRGRVDLSVDPLDVTVAGDLEISPDISISH